MEVKIKGEYQKLIDKLQKALKRIKDNDSDPFITEGLITECIDALKILGFKKVLNEDVEKFNNITTNMVETYNVKNHDYGNSFEKSLDKYGLIAALVRMGDKMNRLETLNNKELKVKDESIKDTLLDLASYSIMTILWLNKINSNK